MSSEHELVELANARMPFGKHQGKLLIYIPEFYLIWYKNKGFPAGKLGRQLELILELKVNGLGGINLSLNQKKIISLQMESVR